MSLVGLITQMELSTINRHNEHDSYASCECVASVCGRRSHALLTSLGGAKVVGDNILADSGM